MTDKEDETIALVGGLINGYVPAGPAPILGFVPLNVDAFEKSMKDNYNVEVKRDDKDEQDNNQDNNSN